MFNLQIKENIERIRIDVGTSSTAPNSAFWLHKYKNIAVFGFEPNPYNVQSVLNGTSQYPNDYKVIQTKKIISVDGNEIDYNESGNQFQIFEFAIDNVDTVCKKTFYCTNSLNTGCSSLHKPIDERLNGVKTEKEIEVNVIPLKMFFDEINWNRFEAIEFLKTDCQSNDLNVIKSCGNYLKKICFIQSEYYAHSAYEGEPDVNECFIKFDKYVTSMGFKLFHRTGTDIGYVNEELIGYIIQNGILNDSLELQNGVNYL